jgi:phosphoglycolate phosphatase-like HAD superfamily hydrolase
MKTVICDLDGTLFNIEHRLHYLTEDPADWDAFFAACVDDTPNDWCVHLLTAMRLAGFEIIFVSGRNDTVLPETAMALARLGFEGCQLFMRPAANRESDFKLKSAIYDKHLSDKQVVFVLEDRTQVVEMWREKGLTVLQCEEGDF